MISYYIPLLYTLKTRYNSKLSVISYLITTILPSMVCIIIFNPDFELDLFYDYLIAFICMHCVYEIGYLFNDLITIMFEDQPNDRLGIQSKVLLKHMQNILTMRLIISIVCFFHLYYNYNNNIECLGGLLLCLLVFYTMHNYFRNKFNIISMMLIVSLKYFIPCIPFLSKNVLPEAFCILFLSLPLIRTIEYAGKKRNNIKLCFIKDLEVFRVKYYILIVIFITIGCFLFNKSIILVLLPLFMLLFRLAAMLSMKYECVVSTIKDNRRRNRI